MTVLVRAALVPARMVLGYTPGSERQDGTRVITSDDAHAWVEVYFDGLGWVTFDPTPIGVDRSVNMPWAPRVGGPAGTNTGADPSAPTNAPAPTTQAQDRAGGPVPNAPTGGAGSGPWGTVAVGAGAVLLVLALLALPAGARVWQRRRRLATGSAAGLWDELTATALDIGLRTRLSWTPRQAAAELTRVASRPGAPAGHAVGDAIGRLARAEEAATYAPAGRDAVGPELVDALHTARRGLLATAPPGIRFRARAWPASLLAVLRSGATRWAQRRPALLGGRRRARSRTA